MLCGSGADAFLDPAMCSARCMGLDPYTHISFRRHWITLISPQWFAVSLHFSAACYSSNVLEIISSPCLMTTLLVFLSQSLSSWKIYLWPGFMAPKGTLCIFSSAICLACACVSLHTYADLLKLF